MPWRPLSLPILSSIPTVSLPSASPLPSLLTSVHHASGVLQVLLVAAEAALEGLVLTAQLLQLCLSSDQPALDVGGCITGTVLVLPHCTRLLLQLAHSQLHAADLLLGCKGKGAEVAGVGWGGMLWNGMEK